MAREHAPVVVERRPVGIGAADDDPPTLREGVGDRAEVEGLRCPDASRAPIARFS